MRRFLLHLINKIQRPTKRASRSSMSIPSNADVPVGIWLIQKIGRRHFGANLRINRTFAYKSSVLLLTFIAYMCFHLTRKPIAVVKSVLHRNCSNLAMTNEYLTHLRNIQTQPIQDEDTWCDYPPFDGADSAVLLGYLDSGFLFTYAIAMFGSGFVAERVSLRYFLSLGMLLSGIFCYLFGAAKVWDIHSIWYFLFVQILAGFFQTTGWPGVMTVIGRWFGKSKHGMIFGIWNSHTSFGNILGTVVAAHYLESDWALSFIVPGCIMGVMGFVMFLFLVDSPELVGCQEQSVDSIPNHYSHIEAGHASENNLDAGDEHISVGGQDVAYRPTERTPILSDARDNIQRWRTNNYSGSDDLTHHTSRTAIGFGGALRIPGVIEFSLCLFFSKLVSYTFLYWLPLYIQSSTTFGAKLSAYISVLFDIGGIVGAIAAGAITDYSGMSATTCFIMLIFAVPILISYQMYGALSIYLNGILLFLAGVFVNGPYALITTSVSTNLGQHSSLEGNSKALATVTAIIDGTGSIGAAIGPFIAGIVSGSGWHNVFHMLVVSDIMAMVFLTRLFVQELSNRRRPPRIE